MKFIDEESEERSLPYVGTIIGAVVIGLFGVYLRFAEFPFSSQIADVILFIATVIVFGAVFSWLKVSAPRSN